MFWWLRRSRRDSAIDIDELRQTHERLKENEARLRLAVAAANIGLFDVDLRTGTVQYSAEWKRQVGYGDDEISTSFGEWQSRVHPEDFERCQQAAQKAMSEGTNEYDLEFRFRHKNGAYLWIMSHASVQRDVDGVPIRLLGSHIDMTQTKLAQLELLSRNAALEAAANAVVITDRAGVIQWANRAFTTLTGYTLDEAVGKNPRELVRSGQHSREFYKDLWDTVLSGRVWSNEMINRRKDGSLYCEDLTITPLCDENGVVSQFIAVKQDITDRKQAEEARAHLEAQLNLAQKMEALGTLAGGIAHDFNNILGAIIGNVVLAEQDIGAGHAAMESLEEIFKASCRAKELVQRILTFSRPQVPQRSVISLRPVVQEALALLRATLPAGVELSTTFDSETPNVLADPTQIHQVLMNLCTNSWRAMQGEQGRIEIRLEGVTVDGESARGALPGQYVRLSVTDNGVGMDAATVKRIFEPFFTTKPVGEGTGLGLSVVHGIVKAHGGWIRVSSRSSIGTTFDLYFPAARGKEEVAAPESRKVEASANGAGLHVLYVDDEEALVTLTTRLLERRGYKVSGFTDASEALAAVRLNPAAFDLAVTDFNMPGMSGLDLSRELMRLRPDLPVAVTSGYITEELRAAALGSGVRVLLHKPDTVNELCSAVQHLADGLKP
ncbi:MAG: PAS domain S-box protein [Deltaproteobacteria bacterium]|nr:PAS domain S-box protein [Deltaproteobacteria bacterium]